MTQLDIKHFDQSDPLAVDAEPGQAGCSLDMSTVLGIARRACAVEADSQVSAAAAAAGAQECRLGGCAVTQCKDGDDLHGLVLNRMSS